MVIVNTYFEVSWFLLGNVVRLRLGMSVCVAD
jgi:hypothetical protein